MKKVYDIIGDIHGHADELEALLARLGYREINQVYRHPAGRRVIFLGDYIDRGPKIQRVLEIVKSMTDAGEALAILGNHEVNALRYHTTGCDGLPLRPHSKTNRHQHEATLTQIANPDPAAWQAWLEWFAGLPLSLDLGPLRAVHACWDGEAIAELQAAGRLGGSVLEKYSRKNTAEYETISQILNGPEALLPAGFLHETADGTMRAEMRVKWWLNLQGTTCRAAIFPDNPEIPDEPLRDIPRTGYPTDAPPTFFGHYALKDPTPTPLRSNLACLDYGTGKGGFLCAYRWDGETSITPGKFITTKQGAL